MKDVHWFFSEEDCKQFFERMAKTQKQVLTPDFIIEGNSNTCYKWVIAIAKIVGYESLGVRVNDYEREDLYFIDEIFIKPTRAVYPSKDIQPVDISSDETTLYPDGSISIWWD